MDKKKIVKIVIGVVLFLAFGCVYLRYNNSEEPSVVVTEGFTDEVTKEQDKTEEHSQSIYVHICGEVRKPGVYTFEGEPRVVDVVKKAGGFTKKAKQDCINMAQQVQDGQQLVIAAKTKTSNKKKGEKNTSEGIDSNKVDINIASKDELMTLSGIGESKATQNFLAEKQWTIF